MSPSLAERVDSGDFLAENERVDVVCSLVGIYTLEIRHVPHRRVLRQDPVRPEEAPGLTRDIRGHVHVVPFGQGDLLEISLIKLAPPNPDYSQLERELSLMCGQVTFLENRLLLRSGTILDKLPEITSVLKAHQLDINEIQFRGTSLEDVFIHLTGRGLRA